MSIEVVMYMNPLDFAWQQLSTWRRARRVGSQRRKSLAIEDLEPRWLPSAVCDLTPVLVDGPASAEPGSKIFVKTTVDNIGADASSKFRVEYRLSLDGEADDQDRLLTTTTRKKVGGNGRIEWTQTVKLPPDVPAGTYHLGVLVDPANRILEANETNNSLAELDTIVVAPTKLTGRVQFEKSKRPVEIHVLGNSGTPIDPTVTTWLVIHGRNGSSTSPNLVELATQIDQYQPNDQVLLLDWSKAAKSGTLGGQGENFIRPVATWAANALTAYGFTGQQLNLVGYSWGADVAAELGEVIGQVNSILAIDPARDYPGGSYNPEAPGEVNFAVDADQSWAFFASASLVFGSATTAGTAENAFVVTGSDHFGIVSLVTNLISLPDEDAVGSYFPLAQLLTGIPDPIWVTSSYSSLGVLDLAAGTFEAVLMAAPNGMTVQSLKFFDGVSEQTVTG